MSCPRCSYPETDFDKCRLCGLVNLAEYELNRFQSDNNRGFEITLVFPDRPEFQFVKQQLDESVAHLITNDQNPRIFVFFDDTNSWKVNGFLETQKGLSAWKFMINGRERPYSEELWLPLLQILSG